MMTMTAEAPEGEQLQQQMMTQPLKTRPPRMKTTKKPKEAQLTMPQHETQMMMLPEPSAPYV